MIVFDSKIGNILDKLKIKKQYLGYFQPKNWCNFNIVLFI